MKRILILVSVVLNAGFLWAVSRPPAPLPGSAPQPARAVVVTTKEIRHVEHAVEVAQPAQTVKLDWHKVESEDYKEYIRNLRSIACPETTIRDIIVADVNDVYARRWKLMVSPGPVNYWDPWNPNEVLTDPKLRALKQNWELERKALLRELLGTEYDREMRQQEISWTWLDREDAFWDFLPAERAAAVRAMKDKCRALTHEVEARAVNGKLSPADQKEYDRIRQQEKDEMKAYLSPDEYQGYLMRNSGTANRIRSSSIGFGMQEHEFVAAVHAEWIEASSPADLDQKREQKLKEAFGEERYQEYQRTKDPAFRELAKLAVAEDLPREKIVAVHDAKQQFEKQAAAIRSDATRTPQEQAAALLALQVQAQQSVSGLMGESAYSNYTSRSGYWLRTLGR